MKRLVWITTLVIAAGVILTGCRERRPEWREFSPREDFSVMMPAEPREVGFKFSDEDEEVQLHLYKAKYRGHTYRVMTGNILDESDIEELLKIGFEVRLGKWSVDERDILYNGFPGKEIISSRPRRTTVSRYYAVGNRFYILSVRYKNRYLLEEDVETFFNSFKVHPPADTAN
ncbi:hypothetical protein JXM67_11745 [candidate division WOR-3 bacterium]|nr:hypothetical protein [candidate division WOR-3 bacterium]